MLRKGDRTTRRQNPGTRLVRLPHLTPGHKAEDGDSGLLAIQRSVHLASGSLLPDTRYRILKWLGQGGMGAVYEATHIDIERRVAIKILRADVAANPKNGEMLRDEARAATRSGSSNIVEIFDFGTLPDGRVWFAMELLEGSSLVDLLNHAPVDASRVIPILRQVCKGLAAAHDAGIVHRDVKPENIVLLERDGRKDFVKIVDFGISTMLAGSRGVGSAGVGTPHYMAPEQVMGLPFDGRLDMYALGCTAYEMMTGMPPFVGSQVEEILVAHMEDEPKHLSEIQGVGPISEALTAVVLRCLEKQPEDRFADMRDLEAALCEAQIADGVLTAWDDLPLPDVPAKRRQRLEQEMPDPSAGRPRPRKRRWLLPAAMAGSLALGGVGTFSLLSSPDAAAEPEAVDAVEAVVTQARNAAAKAFFIYPSPEEPKHPTAYSKVVELERGEGLDDAPAKQAAQTLRGEFAETLVRLGNHYWQRDGGMPFAVEFYVHALVFEPDNARARERAPISTGELVSLRTRAASLDFKPAELQAVEPLVALAENEPTERKRKLRELRVAKKTRGVAADANLGKILRSEGIENQPSKQAQPGIDPEPEREEGEQPAAASPTPTTASDAAPDRGAEDSSPTPRSPSARRNPKEAGALARKGAAAMRSGRRQEAERLFHRALDHDRRNPSALIGLSRLHFSRGAYAKAATFGEKAVSRAPRKSSYRIHLGDAYFKMFRYKAARSEYQRASSLGHPEAGHRLAKVRAKLGG